MLKIRVLSSSLPAPDLTKLAGQDTFDGHNKPRVRREIILSALEEKYKSKHLVNFTKSCGTENCEEFDLVDLYKVVHDEGMVRFLVEAWSKWCEMGPKWDVDNCLKQPTGGGGNDHDARDEAVPPLIPCHSAFRRDGAERPSNNVMGAIGYYCTDMVTPIVGTLKQELQEDAYIICSAVNFAFLKNTVVYAVTTHPGHHASRDCFGGYCYLNNAALCAKLMQKQLETGRKIVIRGQIVSNYWDDNGEMGTSNNGQDPKEKKEKSSKVAILDIDYHCGNGTASILYNDPNVFFMSIHCDPEIDYPWNAGFADQTGSGAGKGTTLHIPLAPGATWEGTYKPALEKAMDAIIKFDADALVVSLGLDTYDGDAVAVNRGGFKLKGNDYYEMGLCMGQYVAGSGNIPVIFVQEGGYKMDTVGRAAADVVVGFAIGAGDS